MIPALNGRRTIAAYRMARWELRLRRALRAAIKVQQHALEARLRSRTASVPPWDDGEWNDDLDEVGDVVRSILSEAAVVAVHKLGKDALVLSSVEDALRARIARFSDQVRGLSSHLVPRLESELATGLAHGESVDALVARVQEVFVRVEHQQRTLVRTWVVGSSNQAAFEAGDALVQAGEDALDRVWLSAGNDGRTRPDHAEADGQRVGPGEPFIVGGEELMWPGDPDGSPEQVMNCRCVTLSLAPDEEIAPA